METRLYKLTDGSEVYECREMTADELQEARMVADDATDGNIYWEVCD